MQTPSSTKRKKWTSDGLNFDGRKLWTTCMLHTWMCLLVLIQQTHPDTVEQVQELLNRLELPRLTEFIRVDMSDVKVLSHPGLLKVERSSWHN